MKQIRMRDDDEHYRDDITRIGQVLFYERDISCSPSEARELWEKYSNSMCAGWMRMDDLTDEDLLACIEPYFDVVEVDE